MEGTYILDRRSFVWEDWGGSFGFWTGSLTNFETSGPHRGRYHPIQRHGVDIFGSFCVFPFCKTRFFCDVSSPVSIVGFTTNHTNWLPTTSSSMATPPKRVQAMKMAILQSRASHPSCDAAACCAFMAFFISKAVEICFWGCHVTSPSLEMVLVV